MKRTNVIFVASLGHSGSTLFDMMLGSHPEVFGLGEVFQLPKLLRSGTEHLCGVCPGECPYWDGRIRRSALKHHARPGSKGLGRRLLSAVRPRDLYGYIAQNFETQFLVDSSKGMGWFLERSTEARRRGHRPILLRLNRDGRAVVNSYLRKYPDRGVAAITDEWIRTVSQLNEAFDQFDGPKASITYESLALDPEGTLRSVCRAINLPFSEGMSRFWEHSHHNIGGNAGTRSQVTHAIKAHSHHQGYYDDHPMAIRLDLRWIDELDSEALDHFESRAGDLNQPFQYDPVKNNG